ncbi:MAG: ATP-dependent sacrificial sulfur transferase LarE [Desulfobacterales bacterium]|nr:ATP-dependent sacrificial sulfur transferase LarE [Desulfobacterales bacterium]
MNSDDLIAKKESLISILKNYDSLAVAFSGGVDSTFLLAAAHGVLGENVAAITAKSPVHPAREIEFAGKFARNHGIKHIIIRSDEMNLSEFTANNRNRCYVCKKNLFPKMIEAASKMGISKLAHGANTDDLKDFRPGFSAASEMVIASPMIEAGLSKQDIRDLSKMMLLETWDKPAMACLATRIPYGTAITIESLKMIEEAENTLIDLGFSACRVRHHGNLARIELAKKDFDRMMNEKTRDSVVGKLKKAGYLYVSMDLEGYVQGSMNR